MRPHRRGDQVIVRHIGQQTLLQQGVIWQHVYSPQPDVLAGRLTRGVCIVDGLHQTELKRYVVAQQATRSRRQLLAQFQGQVVEARQGLGRRAVGHGQLMIEARLGHLKRGGHVEDLFAMLDGDDTTAAEAVAIATAIDLIDDRCGEIAAPQEIGVQRMHDSPLGGGIGGAQRLSQHLTAKDLRTADIATLAAKQPVLQLLELQQPQQVGQMRVHAEAAGVASSATPRRLCMSGLVVVYCKNWRLLGYRCDWMAKAASAASWTPERISFFLPG